ncbi:MAG TPA: hypothetical protein VNT02_13090 [Burkholderiales bacterium]|nr:hypothetical protein [Burkholderiales bacterium]
MEPGRACPLHYRYASQALAAAPAVECETLYVVGGLYGNEQALAEILDMAADEPGGATIIFNGDHNWFDVDPQSFLRINDAVLAHVALRGNVETELASDDDSTGCGCGYPRWVGDAEVARSNAIMSRLRATARAHPELRAALGRLPMYGAASVGGMRTAIVHGDCESLAGWRYAQEALHDSSQLESAARDFEAVGARIIASTHTCLPVAARFDTPGGACVLINNGAAGMPNFLGTRYGVITRIALTPPRDALYGTQVGRVYVDALAVHYDHDAWSRTFLASWPPGSPAYDSYYGRITAGPRYDAGAAARWRAASAAA